MGRKPIWKKKWVWIVAVLLVIGANANLTDNNKEQAPLATSTTPKVEKVKKEKKLEEQKKVETFDFSKAEVNKENVLKAAKEVLGDTKISSVDINIEKGVTIVDVNTVIEDTWSEKTLVKGFANQSVKVYEKLFTNSKVGKVWVWTSTKMIDEKGNEKIEPVINCALTKENAKEVNWTNFKPMVIADYKNLFNIADGSFIHPAIAKKLK
ncbi:hypothetical protein [Clostridium cylindrosporum]|uniref:Uncharacterized protein n=1 Tax=Clostridium cylindrosporum DSM 605 TaxID=1121307 RepID=A0A0J8DAU4_CLOCY|nr:hypothetical protein [Clostridium cylindrosporum]KMT22972.1 hypothetical protein CLCY_7c00190 [Clostridium cylindrosporum DSM 605]